MAQGDIRFPVSCVEHGRWGYRGSRRFIASPDFSYTSLRKEKLAAVAARRRSVGDHLSDQARVWAEVARKHAELGSSAPTGAMHDAFDHRGADLEGLMRPFARPQPGQTGVVVCVGGRPVAFDGFDRPETLTGLWRRLVSGYAIEALGAPSRKPSPEGVDAFVARIRTAHGTAHDAVGLGTEVVLTDEAFVASGLVWRDAVVHLAAFSDASTARKRPGRRVPPSWFRDVERGG